MEHPSLRELSNSLSKNEIAITFVDPSLLMFHKSDQCFLLSLDNKMHKSKISRYNLQHIPLYKLEDRQSIDGMNIEYNDTGFSMVYASKKFCVGMFYGCDYQYIYDKNTYIDGEVYFYNLNTYPFIENITQEKYNIEKPLSIIWDATNYILIHYE